MPGSRSHTPDLERGLAVAPSPTMHQRIKAIGVPTALAISSPLRRSNPGTPTQPRRPDFIGVPGNGGSGGNGYYGGGGSPQRRFLSEGELLRGGEGSGGYSRTNNTVDNIRELAGSPQRGVYTWKDTSPSGYDQYRSNPTSPTGRGYYRPPAPPVYHHQSPQAKRKAGTPSGRRPMSFVRALEVSDSLEMQAAVQERRGTTPTPDRASVYDMNYEISV